MPAHARGNVHYISEQGILPLGLAKVRAVLAGPPLEGPLENTHKLRFVDSLLLIC